MTFLVMGLLLAGQARQPEYPGALLCYLAGALFITAAAFLASAIIALTGRDDAQETNTSKRRSKRRAERPSSTTSRALRRWRARAARVTDVVSKSQLSGDSLAILTTLALSTIGLFTLLRGWHTADPTTPASREALIAGVLIALAFPVLVLERYFATLRSQQTSPDSAMLARLCRVPLLALLGLGIASLLRWLDFPAAARLAEHAIAAITALVGLELGLRSVAGWYTPRSSAADRSSRADSAIAGLLRLQRPDFASLSASASRHFGIDLTRSWALGFIRRAATPSLIVLAAFTWLLTGVSALGLSERAVYESLGTPAGVLHPGLHVHLPWPLGVLRPVEFGTVHEIPVVFAADDGTPVATTATAATDVQTEPTSSDSSTTPTSSYSSTASSSNDPSTASASVIEGPAPPAADRLWDASHPSEASYLVASTSNGRQNFEVINIDLRVLYRIGLSDEAAGK